MFENKLTHNGIHYSRYIASWRRKGGKIYRGGLFEKWLKEKEELTDEEIAEILIMAENGKLELQDSAEQFMKEHENENWEERKVSHFGGVFEDCRGRSFNSTKELLDKALQPYKAD